MSLLSHVMATVDLLDDPSVTGQSIVDHLRQFAPDDVHLSTVTIGDASGSTDFIRIMVAGTEGRMKGGSAPTLGIIGRLGGIGARPERIGFVSDGDGAAAALSAARKLCDMAEKGDRLVGDVIVTTHICPDAPTRPHEPVPFMDSPVTIEEMNGVEVTPEMDAILSIDTTEGNRIMSYRGIAISPTVKEGYILKVSDDLVSLLEAVTGEPARVFPLSVQDITPYGNDLYHLNSILQPATATDAPVVGVALSTVTPIAGCATGASHEVDIEQAARFAIEVAKSFGAQQIHLHDADEFDRLVSLYGPGHHYQSLGQQR